MFQKPLSTTAEDRARWNGTVRFVGITRENGPLYGNRNYGLRGYAVRSNETVIDVGELRLGNARDCRAVSSISR